jgi:ABC-type histidine transport system ATPase subunit
MNEFDEEKKTFIKKNVALKNDLIDQKFAFRIMKQKLKTLKIVAQNYIKNMRESITSLYQSFDLHAEMTANIVNINAIINCLEKFKRFTVISNSIIFTENKNKIEHYLIIMQSKLKVNEN